MAKARRQQVWIDPAYIRKARAKARKDRRTLKSTIEMAIDAAMQDGDPGRTQ